MQDTLDNVISVGGGILFGLGGTIKGLAIMPMANEGINTFLMASIGGAGGYLAKEGLRLLFKAIKNKRNARKGIKK